MKHIDTTFIISLVIGIAMSAMIIFPFYAYYKQQQDHATLNGVVNYLNAQTAAQQTAK